jgi:predicted  nucleic acid-binding Zn-ribbon protein
MANKRMTIEDLAEVMQRTMVSKEDIKAVREEITGVKDRVVNVEHIQKDILNELNATHDDVRYVRTTITMLAHTDAAHEAAIESLTARMARIEKKVGLAP